MSQPLPQWAADYLSKWQQRLLLQEWEIDARVAASPCEDGSGSTLACVRVQPNIFHADIEVLDQIPGDADEGSRDGWQRVLIHELLHIRIGRLTDHVERDLLPQLAPAARSVAGGVLEREVEPVVDILARILHGMECDADAA